MKSFLALLVAALCGSAVAFAPRSAFMPSQQLSAAGAGASSLMTMNAAAERTYIMVRKNKSRSSVR
jgi:hypothetical protein